MNNSVDTMMVDFEDNLWFTSFRQGVMKIVKSPFTDVTRLAHLENTVVNTTCIYQGKLYIGTDTGLQLLDKNSEQKENVLTKLLEGVRICCIKEDSAGNLWLCTYSDYVLACYSKDGSYKLYNEEATSVSRHELQPVSYTNLDSGEYVFRLSVIDIMTGKETNSIAIRIVKTKAFYEQAWFWLMMAAVIILLILFVVHTYTCRKMAKLIEKQEENGRFISQMIHIRDGDRTGACFGSGISP